jgi:hypothetical protein
MKWVCQKDVLLPPHVDNTNKPITVAAPWRMPSISRRK